MVTTNVLMTRGKVKICLKKIPAYLQRYYGSYDLQSKSFCDTCEVNPSDVRQSSNMCKCGETRIYRQLVHPTNVCEKD
jgi:hypothetical protein